MEQVKNDPVKLHKISVREVVDFILRSGDITTVSLSDKRMVDGTRAHQRFQREQDETYDAEVPIHYSFERDDISFMITGRIDGVIPSYEGALIPLIDEIKSVSGDFSAVSGDNIMHWAQCKMYAYMYLIREGLKEAKCRLTYVDLDTFAVKHFVESLTFQDLEAFLIILWTFILTLPR